MEMSTVIISLLGSIVFIAFYVRKLNRLLAYQPPEALALSPHRWTPEEIKANYQKYLDNPVTIDASLPARTGNRYIIVGGSGFTGGWIVVHLLTRGEDPSHIRILDIRAPTRSDLITGRAREIEFFKVDISNASEVERAMSAPWSKIHSQASTLTPLTVIHTAANIRFYERFMFLMPRSDKVNYYGTDNLLESARKAGAKYFIYTSSASVAIARCRYWLWPWQNDIKNFVQVLRDDSSIPPRHSDFFSNYAYSKWRAEKLVRGSNGSLNCNGDQIRTGCIRPGNGVYGPGGDISVASYLVRKVNPTWLADIIQSEIYVENVSLAHLLYERRLMDATNSQSDVPDLGGQVFSVADPNPPVAYGDLYNALMTLTNGETVFPKMPAGAMLIFAHIVETLYIGRIIVTSIPVLGPLVSRVLPQIGGDIVNLQPSLFPLTSVHLLLDDSRARLPPSKGGLGFNAPFTTLDGVCKLVHDFKMNGPGVEERQKNGGGGVGFGFGLLKAERSVGKAAERIGVIDTDSSSPTSNSRQP